jgi:hypothetical protein
VPSNPRLVEPFCFDRSFSFPLTVEDFWHAIERVDEFPRWWGWLRSFDSDGLVTGGRAAFVVQSALPYQLSFSLELIEVTAPRLVVADVRGDLAGRARLEIDPEADGCRARLAWQLTPLDSVLRRMASFSRPLMAWSHDQVVRLGLGQFRRHILAQQAGAPD